MSKAATAIPAATATPTATATPGAGKGILKIVPVSQPLAKFAGESELSRASAVKKVWEYIKGQNLQVWDFYSVNLRLFCSFGSFTFLRSLDTCLD